MLKTLTPWQSLVQRAFAGEKVKLSGRLGEVLRESEVMGFGDTGE